MDRNYALEIAKVIGQPIDPNIPVSPLVKEIAMFETAEPGDDVKVYTSEDANAGDSLYTVAGDGSITQVKITPNTPATLTFSGLQTAQEYVLLHEVLNTLDASAFARRRESFGRAMDKKEVKELLDLVLAAASQEVVEASGDDIYDVIEKQVALVEDYGDDLILLAGSDAFRSIRKYSKDKATTFNYDVLLAEDLKNKFGINAVQKVVGEFKVDGGSAQKVLNPKAMILVARNSTISDMKPLVFVRRIIRPELAAVAGLQVDARNQRAVIVTPVPTPLMADGKMVSGYGTWGYEDRIAALINKRAVAWTILA